MRRSADREAGTGTGAWAAGPRLGRQRWAPALTKALIDQLFHVSYTAEGTWLLLKRQDWSWQQPGQPGQPGDRTRRHGGRGLEGGDLAAGKSTAAACNGWIVFEDEAGRSMTPPRARSWGRKGSTPVVRARGRGSGRVFTAG
ncbi:winged helix-turn-helix domain-containing protein [Streptomyces sp. NPDC012438]|uniref:winged helix-turn-helix domain-containing protein n=1 Tax=Streptomyces sp. NPDC012438 TaxID=3364833 RepID=UPI0036F07F95